MVKNTNNKFCRVAIAVALTLPILHGSNSVIAAEPTLFPQLPTTAGHYPDAQLFTIHPAYSSDLASLTTEDKKRLDEIAEQFNNKIVTGLKVSGHTDSSVIRPRSRGLFADNYALSRSRAQNVADYLKLRLKIDDTKIQVEGRGSEQHIASNATRKGRATNRRVELNISATAVPVRVTEKKTAPQFVIHPVYNSDLASLTTEDKKRLGEIATQFKNKTVTGLKVSGHTDSSVIRPRTRGLFADNYALSRSRAQNVADYLKLLLKIDDTKIQVVGQGSDQPIASNATRKGRATNRRVELNISATTRAIPVAKTKITPRAPKAIVSDGFTLQQTVKKALASNPDVFIQVNERRSRNEEVERAKAGYLPTLDLNAGIGTERSRNSSTRASGNDYRTLTRQEGSISARQMLFDGFATKSEVERQRARVSSTAYTVQGVAENTALEAAEAYLNLLRNDTLLKLAQENLDAHKRSFDQIKIRSEAGVGRRADLEQISGRLALANSNLIAAKSNYDDGVTTYIRVIGEAPVGTPIKPEKIQANMPATREQAIDQAIEKHPTLKSAVADVEATMAQHRASRNTFYPRFDLELSQSWNNNLDGQTGTNNDSQAMVRMRYNLLNGGGDAARKRQTAHLIEEAREVRNRTYRQVVETMRLSWNAFSATEQQLVYLDDHVKATVRTRDAYQKQFNIGQRTLLDLLNAENELFQAKQSYISAEFDNLFARYRILNAEGELLRSLNISLPEEAKLASGN